MYIPLQRYIYIYIYIYICAYICQDCMEKDDLAEKRAKERNQATVGFLLAAAFVHTRASQLL